MCAMIASSSFIISKTINPTTKSHYSSSSTKPFLLRSSNRSTAATMASDLHSKGRSRLLDFPYVSSPVKNLMTELISMVENQFGSDQLLPCKLPEDVQFYQNDGGSSKASLYIRSGTDASKVDFMLGSWLHCGLPTGGVLNITSLSMFHNSKTDSPNFLIELIQSSPTTMVLILDLPPRKDLILYPEYLKTFYEDTKLDTQRQMLSKLPEVTPYVSPSLYIRSVVSPTAILVNVKCEEGGAERIEEIVSEHIYSVAIDVMRIWLDASELEGRDVSNEERLVLERRDEVVKNKTIEIDLGSSLPRLFGQEIADKVLAAIKDVFNGKNQSQSIENE